MKSPTGNTVASYCFTMFYHTPQFTQNNAAMQSLDLMIHLSRCQAANLMLIPHPETQQILINCQHLPLKIFHETGPLDHDLAKPCFFLPSHFSLLKQPRWWRVWCWRRLTQPRTLRTLSREAFKAGSKMKGFSKGHGKTTEKLWKNHGKPMEKPVMIL